MKIRFTLGTILIGLIITLLSCDDNLNPVGGSVQPGSDIIFFRGDTFDITAKTIKWDSIYTKTAIGLVGEYEEPVFGKIVSDYMCEFYCDEETNFKDKVVSIDSVSIHVYVELPYIGDSISPIGLSAYKLNKKLERNFYTNINPRDYCDLTKVLGRNLFSLSNTKTISGGIDGVNKSWKIVPMILDTLIGREIHDKWEADPSTFHTPEALKSFLPGIYITQTFGTGTLMPIRYTLFNIDYSYVGRNYNDTKDSIRTAVFQLANTSEEVIQMNRVENSNIDKLLEEGNPKRTYMKTPAGVYTELTIPLNKIAERVGKDTIVNSAKILLKGLTEEEQYSQFKRPNYLLFINKDSVDIFFKEKLLPNNTTRFLIPYTSSSNSYNFNNAAQYNNITSGYIPKMINFYLNKFRGENYTTIPDLKYVLIPVEIKTKSSSSYYGTTTILTSVSNMMLPSSSIIRADEDNLKFEIIYTKYKER